MTAHAPHIADAQPVRTEALQRACACGGASGGTCAACAEEEEALGIQPRLAISAPGDRWEQEADRIAERIVSDAPPQAAPVRTTPLVQRQAQPQEEDEEEVLQTRRAGPAAGPGAAMGAAAHAAGVVRSGGRPLAPAERSYFEPRFGRDLSGVRLHTDAVAGRAASGIGARAYTLGAHIAFAPGAYAPHSAEGLRLIAHELTHTLQQTGASAPPRILRPSLGPGPFGEGAPAPLRVDAPTLRRSEAPQVTPLSAPGLIQRQCPPERRARGAAAGCGVCLGGNAGVTGALIHRLVEYQFFFANPDMAPPGGAMELVVPTAPEGETAPFNPEVDLSLITEEYGLRVIYIGELKPFDDAGVQRQAALDKLDDYARELREGGMFDEVRLLRRDPPPAFTFHEPGYPPGCPRQRIHTCRIEDGVYQYFCEPPWSDLVRDPRCRCRRGDEEDEEERRRRDEEEDDTDLDVDEPIDTPVAPPVAPHGEDRPERPERPDFPDVPVPIPGLPEAPPQTRPGGPEETEPGGDDGGGEVIPFPPPVPVPGPEDVPEELPEAAFEALTLATAAAVIYGVARRFAGGPAQKYAEAMAIAVLVVFYSDRVEASPGLSGESPLTAVFDAMASDGVPVPEEMRARLEADPELRAALEEAARGGSLDDAQRAVSQSMMDAIAADPDAFSNEDLEVLATISDATSGGEPAGQVSAETLRRAIDARREGRPLADELRQPGAEGAGGVEEAPRTEETPPEPIPGVSEELRRELARNPEVERLFRAITRPGGEGPEVDDEAVRRFLATVPDDLTAEETSALVSRLRGSEEARSLDAIMESLARAVEEIRAPAAEGAVGERTAEFDETPAPETAGTPTEEAPETTEEEAPTTEPPISPGTEAPEEEGPEEEGPTRDQRIARIREFLGTGPEEGLISPGADFTFTEAAVGTTLFAATFDGALAGAIMPFTVVRPPNDAGEMTIRLTPTEFFDIDGNPVGTFPRRPMEFTATLVRSAR